MMRRLALLFAAVIAAVAPIATADATPATRHPTSTSYECAQWVLGPDGGICVAKDPTASWPFNATIVYRKNGNVYGANAICFNMTTSNQIDRVTYSTFPYVLGWNWRGITTIGNHWSGAFSCEMWPTSVFQDMQTIGTGFPLRWAWY